LPTDEINSPLEAIPLYRKPMLILISLQIVVAEDTLHYAGAE
jgi:hypothetical protein